MNFHWRMLLVEDEFFSTKWSLRISWSILTEWNNQIWKERIMNLKDPRTNLHQRMIEVRRNKLNRIHAGSLDSLGDRCFHFKRSCAMNFSRWSCFSSWRRRKSFNSLGFSSCEDFTTGRRKMIVFGRRFRTDSSWCIIEQPTTQLAWSCSWIECNLHWSAQFSRCNLKTQPGIDHHIRFLQKHYELTHRFYTQLISIQSDHSWKHILNDIDVLRRREFRLARRLVNWLRKLLREVIETLFTLTIGDRRRKATDRIFQ